MKSIRNNSILPPIILCFFALLLLLSPVITSTTPTIAYTHAQAAGTPIEVDPMRVSGSPDDVAINNPPGESTCDMGCQIAVGVGNVILKISSSVTWLGGTLFDTAIDQLVLQMGDKLVHGGIGDQINKLWQVVRDVCNIVFIFGFVFIGIKTILDPGSAGTKKFLSQLIFSAIFINFSLYLTKIVIDVSNVFTLEIYKLIISSNFAGNSIGGAFLQVMGVNGLYTTIDASQLASLGDWGGLAFFVMGSLFLLVTGFVLGAGAFMIVIRFVALIFIMIFSPIILAGKVFPGALSKQADDVLSKLFSYAFFAPVFLFLVYVSLHILSIALSLQPAGSSLASTLIDGVPEQTSNNFFSVTLTFVMAITFLVFSLHVAKNFSIYGGKGIISFGNNLRNTGQRMLGGATFGALGGLGRGTIGKAAQGMAESDSLRDKASNSWAHRQVLKAASATSQASFDARRVGGVGKKLGIGEGSAGGYVADVEKAQKQERAMAGLLGSVGDDDIAVKARQEEVGATEKAIRDAKEDKRIASEAYTEQKRKIGQEISRLEADIKKTQAEANRETDPIKKAGLQAEVATMTTELGTLASTRTQLNVVLLVL